MKYSLTLFVSLIAIHGTLTSKADNGDTITARTRRKIDEVVSSFENESPKIQYNYIEALGDSREYTAGRAVFTTGTGDLYEAVDHYLKRVVNSGFSEILPILKLRADQVDGSIVGLEALPALWVKAANDPIFREIQDDVTNERYFNPALIRANLLDYKTALGLLVLYNTSSPTWRSKFQCNTGPTQSETHERKSKNFKLFRYSLRRANESYGSDYCSYVARIQRSNSSDGSSITIR